MIIITKKRRKNWEIVKKIYPYKKLTKHLYVIRIWSKSKMKLSPWILAIITL